MQTQKFNQQTIEKMEIQNLPKLHRTSTSLRPGKPKTDSHYPEHLQAQLEAYQGDIEAVKPITAQYHPSKLRTWARTLEEKENWVMAFVGIQIEAGVRQQNLLPRQDVEKCLNRASQLMPAMTYEEFQLAFYHNMVGMIWDLSLIHI